MEQNENLQKRLHEIQQELTETQNEFDNIVRNTDILTDEDAELQCNYLMDRIEILTGELESIISAI